MKHWTIRKRISFGFAVNVLLTVALAGSAWFLLRSIKAGVEQITVDALPGLSAAATVSKNAGYIQISVLRHLMAKTNDERKGFETQIESIVAKNGVILDEYEKTIVRPEERAAFDKVKETRTAYAQARAHLFALDNADNAGKDAEAFAYNVSTARPAFDAYQTACDAFFDENNSYGMKSSGEIQQTIQHANGLITLISIFAVALGITLGLVIISGLTKVLNAVTASLRDGSNQVASASGQVSAASQTLAEGSSEQASSLEETSSSLEEMASMTKRNAEHTLKANELAKEARQAADRGVGDMQTMAAAMDDIKNSSDDIAKIIKTIDEIAFQTNILALNAAVEAARAGEAGMGFAVVADEVRNLAQRCAQAAKETSAKIEGAIAKSGQGVEITSKVALVLNEVVTKVRQVDELVTEVASASREQTDGIAQINMAVGQMDKVTQGNAATAEESAAAAQELNAQAETMNHSVEELMQLVGGATSNPAATVKPAREFRAARPAAKSNVSSPRNGSRNGHAKPAASLSAPKDRRGEIPMEGDFKDF